MYFRPLPRELHTDTRKKSRAALVITIHIHIHHLITFLHPQNNKTSKSNPISVITPSQMHKVHIPFFLVYTKPIYARNRFPNDEYSPPCVFVAARQVQIFIMLAGKVSSNCSSSAASFKQNFSRSLPTTRRSRPGL